MPRRAGPGRDRSGTPADRGRHPGSRDCAAALGFAFEEAALRNASLLAVHARQSPRSVPDPHAAAAATELGAMLSEWRQKYPDVAASQDVVHDHPGRVLAGLSARVRAVPPRRRGQAIANAGLLHRHALIRTGHSRLIRRDTASGRSGRGQGFAEQVIGHRARFRCVGEAGADGEAITVLRIAEAEIGADLGRQLQALLRQCFPGYPGRSYFKLPPHFRYLAMTGCGCVAAQMGVEFRVIRVGDAVVRTFGVVDLCVQESQRSQGVASGLLAEVTGLARSCAVAFIVLFADDDRLYARNGWARVANRCSWVRIDEHVTLGLARHADTGAMMIKAIGEHSWPDGDVDLLGHLF